MEEQIKRIVFEALNEYFAEHPVQGCGQDVTSTRRILNVEQLAEYLGISKQWIYQNVGKIPHYKMGNLVRFKMDEIEEWQEDLKYQAPSYGKVVIRRVK